MKKLFPAGPSHPNYRHGLSRHPARLALIGARERCFNPKNPRYDRYGARGITVCQTWLDDFGAFWAEMGSTWSRGLTLERIDNDGHYEPGNCRWATSKEQARNRHNNVLVETRWGQLLMVDVAERSGLHLATLWSRYRRGWRGEQLLSPLVSAGRSEKARLPASPA